MGKVAFVFSIIGCGRVGMGRDLYRAYPEFRDIFDRVCALTRMDLARFCFEGPEERLLAFDVGTYVQFAMSLGCYRILAARGMDPDFFSGMCEGQVMSWVAAGALDVEPAVDVCRRVVETIRKAPIGLMARVIGLDVDSVRAICRQASRHGIVDLAIVLEPRVISIAGEPRAVKAALELARHEGAEEARPLSIEPRPVHSRLLEPLVSELQASLRYLKFRDPRVPFVSALDHRPKVRAAELLPTVMRELCSTSHWHGAIRWLLDHDVDTFVSLGVARGKLVRLDGEQATSLYVYDLPTLQDTLAHWRASGRRGVASPAEMGST